MHYPQRARCQTECLARPALQKTAGRIHRCVSIDRFSLRQQLAVFASAPLTRCHIADTAVTVLLVVPADEDDCWEAHDRPAGSGVGSFTCTTAINYAVAQDGNHLSSPRIRQNGEAAATFRFYAARGQR